VLSVAVLSVRTLEGFVDHWRFKTVMMCIKTFRYPSLIGPSSLFQIGMKYEMKNPFIIC